MVRTLSPLLFLLISAIFSMCPKPSVAQSNPVPNCPADFSGGRLGQSFSCACRAGSVEGGSVWGDGIYTADSSICLAARHAGVIDAVGGSLLVTGEPGRSAYTGATRNGVDSEPYDSYPMSFRVARTSATGIDITAQCPENFSSYRGIGQPLRCVCAGEETVHGSVWGTDIYSDDSGICRAAVHAGAIGFMGGSVTVLGRPGQSSYLGRAQNGLRSNEYGNWEGSFTFDRTGASISTSITPIQASVADSIARRGQVQLYINFATNSADLDARAHDVLTQLRDVMRMDASLSLTLVGHTDTVGGAAQNKPLSLRRATSVRTWLVGQGIAATRLHVDGRGAEQPIADNATESGRALNRRVTAMRR
jgi:outer membrane protein OmpA-like peptidoglycan-associated protein